MLPQSDRTSKPALTPRHRRLLAEFVNREREMARFRAMLDDPDMAVFAVWGGGGVGKSSLQAKMIHEVASRGYRKSEVIWTEARNHDLMSIVRKVRDDIDPEAFSALTDLINYFTVPHYELKITIEGGSNINVANSATFDESRTGDIAGVLIKDVMLTEPRRDMQTTEAERRARLTDAFLEGAAKALGDTPGVIFFDATEKMSQETLNWVWHELLPAACDGRMGRAKFVLSGRNEPELRDLRGLVEVAELRPLTVEHVIDYLERRGVAPESCEDLATMLVVVTGGNMLELATHVDNFIKMQGNQSRAGPNGAP